MAEAVLKLAPDAVDAAPARKRSSRGSARGRLRLILLLIVPLIASGIGLEFYLRGGR
jgi:hypothetical protein